MAATVRGAGRARAATTVEASLGAAALLSLGTVAFGCSSPPSTPMPMVDAPPTPSTARNDNVAVFEGQRNVVTVLSAAGADLSAATVIAEGADLEVTDFVCSGERCGVVVAVPDRTPDRGQPVPPPIDATNRYLRIVTPGAIDRRALFSVAPLDSIDHGGGDPATVRGTYFAASMSSIPTSVFRGASGLEPVRWFVFGDATLRGTVDVSAVGAMPGPGGSAGADASAAGAGGGGGGAGSATAGGGGGGSAEAGSAGEGAGGGEGGAAFAMGCALDPFEPRCGGGAGGGAGGQGGGGGGTFALHVLGTLDADATIAARGGDGTDGGGGGGGGRVVVTGSEVAGITVDADGGTGGARAGAAGGDGGAGEASLGLGPTVDTPAFLVREPTLALNGRASAGATLEVGRIGDDTPIATATVGVDGRFSVEVTLIPGLNRLSFVETAAGGSRVRSWSGNHFEIERRGTDAFPVGALLDIAYVP